jgi:predicted DNA-binding protein
MSGVFERTNINLDIELKKKLKKASYLSGKSMAKIINEILSNVIDEYVKSLED